MNCLGITRALFINFQRLKGKSRFDQKKAVLWPGEADVRSGVDSKLYLSAICCNSQHGL